MSDLTFTAAMVQMRTGLLPEPKYLTCSLTETVERWLPVTVIMPP